MPALLCTGGVFFPVHKIPGQYSPLAGDLVRLVNLVILPGSRAILPQPDKGRLADYSPRKIAFVSIN